MELLINNSLMMIRKLVPLVLLATAWAVPVEEAHSKAVPLREIGSRIINGENAVLGQFPWQVALLVTSRGSTWFCGGSIISQDWILTAGHCVLDAENITVLAGSLTVNGNDPERISSFSKQSILHEDYDPYVLENDIGLVQLTEPLTFTDNIQKIDLSDEALGSKVAVTVSGWGKISDDTNSISNDLNFVGLSTITNAECNSYYGIISDGQVCASYDTDVVQSTCNGDSGGPLIVDATSNPTQVGIVSFVSIEGCESGAPSGYTRVAYQREWIKKNSGV